MITVRKIHPSGALEISAHIRDVTWCSWYERQVYYQYSKAEAMRKYREHLRNNQYVLVND